MKEKLLKALKLVYSLEDYYCRDLSDDLRMKDFAELKELLGELLAYYPETPEPSRRPWWLLPSIAHPDQSPKPQDTYWYTYGVPLNLTADNTESKEPEQKPKKPSKKK